MAGRAGGLVVGLSWFLLFVAVLHNGTCLSHVVLVIAVVLVLLQLLLQLPETPRSNSDHATSRSTL